MPKRISKTAQAKTKLDSLAIGFIDFPPVWSSVFTPLPTADDPSKRFMQIYTDAVKKRMAAKKKILEKRIHRNKET